MKKNKLTLFISFLLKTYGCFMLILFLFRVALFILYHDLWKDESLYTITESFFVGLRYDNVIANYIFAIPTLLFLVAFILNKSKKWMFLFAKYWIFVFSSICFLISAADIPFLKFYNSRITITILSWTETPFLMFKAVFTNIWFSFYFLVGVVLVFLWYKCLSFITKSASNDKNISNLSQPLYKKIVFGILFPTIIFFSIRGQINLNYMPIGIKNAYYCDNSFLNQMGLNPAFTFISSFKDDKISLMDIDKAYSLVSNELDVESTKFHCIERKIEFDTLPKIKNVVLVIVESLSAERMGYYGNTLQLTPFLDSLAQNSLFFPNTYSAGIHTYNGIFSSLYALPALLGRNPMTNVSSSNQKFDGLPVQLKKLGYKTIFFCPNNKDFDNLGSFLKLNGYDEIVDEASYPPEKINNGWGVADDFLFENGINVLKSKNYKEPFFATFLTVSTHTPYVIPKNIAFTPTGKTDKDQIYQYADWSIQKFMKLASSETWFSNTLFVFVADHGQNFDPTYEMPLSYHQIPLVFYAPSLIDAKIDKRFALQMDIFPTIMELLKIPYLNNSLGLSLISDKNRPFAFFSADNKIGIVDTSYFYIWQSSGREKIYHYPSKSTKDEFNQQQARIEKMKNYAFSFIQVCDDMFKQKRREQ